MLNLTDENFEREIKNAKKPVLVDFYTIWCPPCRMLAPIFEKLEKEYQDKLIFAKVNLELAPLTAQKYGINVIPTVILFKEEKLISGFVGLRSESIICQWLEENLKNESERIIELIKEYEEYAAKNNLKLNPNRDLVKKLIRALLENEKRYGARYCPCRRISGNPKEDRDKICPCRFMLEEIERDGHCLCGLFVK